MSEHADLAKLVLGRLTWDAIPLHEPILLATFVAVVVGGVATVVALTYFRAWGTLWRDWITSIDHKKIGVMYVILGLVMLLRGFADAVMMRAQQALAFGDAMGYLPPHHYDQIFTAHGVIMIFFVAMPLVTGLMNFAVPLQIGARDVAFPFLNNFSFWMTACGAVLVMRRTNPNANRPFRAPMVPLIPILGILTCLLLMFSLPAENWYRLIIWMAIGFVIYFSYGYKHSHLRKRNDALLAGGGSRRR